MRHIVIFTLLFLAFSYQAACLPEQKILAPGDWSYDALEFLALEQGTVIPADQAITVSRARMILDGFDWENLSDEGQALYDELVRYLDSGPLFGLKSGALSGSFGVILDAELFYKTNEDNAWIYDYHSRHPFLELPLGLAFDPYIAGELIPFVAQHEKAATVHANYSNFPYDPVSQFDIHFPKTAYLSAGINLGESSGIHAALGMGADFFGRTRTGSIFRSDYLDKVNYARLSLYSPVLRYGAEVMQLQVNKYQYMHYLHIRPASWLNLSLAEGVMANAPLELRFLNPFAIFHGYEAYKTYGDYNAALGVPANDDDLIEPSDGSRIGSYFGFKFELQPVNFWRFYGLFAMNQFQLPIEVSEWKDSLTPNAFAVQAGTEAAVPAMGGYWHFGLEGVYTLPYMYVLHHKDWSFYAETDPERNTRVWVGSPFGPDTIAGTFYAGFKTLKWEAALSFVFAAQGERSGTDIFDRQPAEYRPNPGDYDTVIPPTGIPVYTYTVSAALLWKPLPSLHLRFQPGFRFTENPGHISGKSAAGAEFAFSLRYAPGSGGTGQVP